MYDMIVYISNPQNSTKELLQLINTFSNVAEYKINSNNSIALFYKIINELRKKSEKHCPSQ